MLSSLRWFLAEKMAFSSTSTQSVFQGISFKVYCRSKSRLSHSIVGFQILATNKKKTTKRNILW